jgi:hypothetical protein
MFAMASLAAGARECREVCSYVLLGRTSGGADNSRWKDLVLAQNMYRYSNCVHVLISGLQGYLDCMASITWDPEKSGGAFDQTTPVMRPRLHAFQSLIIGSAFERSGKM